MNGIITKGIGSFYTVVTENANIICKPRGIFRKEKISPLPGDKVDISILDDGSGRIEKIHARKNVFIRPPVCNIDLLVVVASQTEPESDPFLIDRMTMTAANKGLEVILCINKCDLTGGETLHDIYKKSGFKVFNVSALTGAGVEDFARELQGKITAFAGMSGVGKSSLLNTLDPSNVRRTDTISQKLQRGRHTTRHVELFMLPNNSIIADTPGFSALDATESLKPEEVSNCFIEFRPYQDECRFTGCIHINVKDCAVYAALERGEISESRYKNYKRLLEISKQNQAY